MTHTELGTSRGEDLLVARAVVGHDTFDLRADASVEGNGFAQELNTALRRFVGLDARECHSGVIVNGQVNGIPADAAVLVLLFLDGSPVMRWPMPLIFPRRLVSICSRSPGDSRSYRTTGSTGSSDFNRDSPTRLNLRLRVAREQRSVIAIRQNGRKRPAVPS